MIGLPISVPKIAAFVPSSRSPGLNRIRICAASPPMSCATSATTIGEISSSAMIAAVA